MEGGEEGNGEGDQVWERKGGQEQVRRRQERNTWDQENWECGSGVTYRKSQRPRHVRGFQDSMRMTLTKMPNSGERELVESTSTRKTGH